MPSLRVLTVDLSDLNLETDVIDGARVEISIERAASFDSFVIVPSLDYKATSDNTGILTFNILPSDSNTRYRVSVTDSTGHQVLTGIFVMPDSDANIADLLDLSFFPDGFNSTPAADASYIQFQSNGVNVGTPASTRKFDILSGSLVTFDPDAFKVTLDLTAIPGAAIAQSSGYRLVTDTEKGTWSAKQDALGFTPFNSANLDTDAMLAANSDSKVASQKAVKTYIDKPKSSVWRIADGSDATKLAAFNLSAIATGTTRTITAPNSNVDLGKIPASYAFTAGLIVVTNTDGTTSNIAISSASSSEVMTDGMTLVSGKYYVVPSAGGAITVNFPSSPANGDFVWIEDCYPETGVTRFNGTAVNLSAGSNWVGIATIYHSINLVDPANAVGAKTPDFKLLYRFNSVNSTWELTVCRARNNLYASAPYIRLYNQYTSKYVAIVIPDATLTGNRSIVLGDSDVDLTRYNTLPGANTSSGNNVSGSASAILAGGSNKTTKQNQAVIVGQSINADSLAPEDSWIYGNRATTYSGARVTGLGGVIKGQSAGTASASLVTGNNTQIPAYLTKPSGHHAVSFTEMVISMTTSAGKVWFGKRRVCVRWDGATATVDTQTTGTDYDPESQSVSFTATVSSGLLSVAMANASAGGGDTCYWQCTYTSHYNGG